jgi:hypothetical protein
MACYVDEAVNPFGRMLMCHLVADSLVELHALADALGMQRRWFQNKPGGTPHYDLSKSVRAKAVKAGAVGVNRYGMAALSMEWKLADFAGRGRTSIEVPAPIPTTQQEWSVWRDGYDRRRADYINSMKV